MATVLNKRPKNPTVLAKKYTVPQKQRLVLDACPICWRHTCHAFHVAASSKIEGAKTRDEFGKQCPVRSDFLRTWHIGGVEVCATCKRATPICRAVLARHATRVRDQEDEVEDARQYVTDELLNAWKSAEGEAKYRLQKEGDEAERRLRKAERRLSRMKVKMPCRPPEFKRLPTWWTEQTAPKKAVSAAPASPLMQQYREAKSKHPDMLLLFRMGDFFEAFDADARTVAKSLGLTITSRDKSTDMAGFPHHQLEAYLHKLLAAGHRMAICEPIESADGKSVQRVATTLHGEAAMRVANLENILVGVPTAAYCDGGVIGSNPSSLGGTWAVVLLDAAGEPYVTASGVVTPEQIAGRPLITNNYTELLAAVEAMERLPEAWTGTLHTDSNVTRCLIVNKRPSMAGIPEDLQRRLAAAKSRLGGAWTPGEDRRGATGGICVVLLNGHPTKAELAAGIGKRGLPTSKWNVLCDKMCGDEAKRFVEAAK